MVGIALPLLPSARKFNRRWLAVGAGWRMAVLFAVATIALYATTGTALSLGGAGKALLLVPLLIAVALFYRYWRPAPAIVDSVETILKLLAILLLGMLISFPAAKLGAHFPLRDALLARADAAIGFNRADYLDFVADHPYLKAVLHAAYLCMIPQFLLSARCLRSPRNERGARLLSQ